MNKALSNFVVFLTGIRGRFVFFENLASFLADDTNHRCGPKHVVKKDGSSLRRMQLVVFVPLQIALHP